VQLLENAVYERKATRVEVRFLKMAQEGFDIIDDGEGISDEDMANHCKTLPNRERNPMYKTRSLGFLGEALHSLVKSSSVTIFTRSKDAQFGVRLVYSHVDCEITSKTRVQIPYGTTIEVRKIHCRNAKSAMSYKKFAKDQYDQAQLALTDYSLILNRV
jgi:DNA mismatch repair ATPase MutL